MIHDESISIRNISLWFLLVGVGLIIAYITFLALISISVGLNHLQQDGSLVPITAGVILIIGCLSLFFYFLKLIIGRMKEKDIINNI